MDNGDFVRPKGPKCRNKINCEIKASVKKIIEDLEEEDSFHEIGILLHVNEEMNRNGKRQTSTV